MKKNKFKNKIFKSFNEYEKEFFPKNIENKNISITPSIIGCKLAKESINKIDFKLK